jgi:hypothetical protein
VFVVRAANWGVLVGGALAWQAACNAADGGAVPVDGFTSTGGSSQGPNLGTGGSTPEPELELEENFRAPVVSGSYLWTANPESNRVAILHAATLAIDVLEGGNAPTFLASLPGDEDGGGALVINVAGGDASIFRHDVTASLGGAGGISVSEERVPVQAGASAWAVGKSGRFAVAWSRFQDDLKGPLDGYQDLTVLELDPAKPVATRLSVGFRPTKVVLNEAETRAYVVSKPGLSVVDLEAKPPRVLREFGLPADETGLSRDVSITADGALALVRVTGEAAVRILDLEADAEAVTVVELPREVTDLDLSADGSLAVAVMRGTPGGAGVVGPELGGQGGEGGEGGQGGAGSIGEDSMVALLPVPEIQDSPEDFELYATPELLGSAVVAEDASVALLYTNAIASSRLTILELDSLEARAVDVTAPIQAAFLTPDAAHAVTIMTPPSGSKAAGAFALVPVAQVLPARIEGTDTVPRFVAVANQSALITTWGAATLPAKTLLGRIPGLTVDTITLGAEPLASGLVLDENRGFVAEAHPQGQVTFINLETAESKTVTGFELSSQVVDP